MARRVSPAQPAGWWLTVGFALLALGPFVYVAGVNTYIPGPWALLRYVPVIGLARTPTRFAIVAALGLAVLLAGALAALGERWPQRRRAIGAVAVVLLVFELWPAPRTLYSGGDLAGLRHASPPTRGRCGCCTAVRRPRRRVVGRQLQRPRTSSTRRATASR